ncbi:GNAT family N-acetyltransferase [Notoacmeibacter marinus]|uniref:GNAT family N-acetyltransferase n=1 Tax=Notoacmeibacter marinus TaxID=1876515 RepID=UPI000DF15008|nr:GNAT family N-acetyltransferase [Notoacmeibacter marinus]
MIQPIARQTPARRTVPAPTTVPFFAGDGWRVVSGSDGHALHRDLTEQAVAFGAPQGPHWAEIWADEKAGQIIYAIFVEDGLPVLSLPLIVHSSFGVTVVAIPGGSHANGSFPALREPAEKTLRPDSLARTLQEIYPEIDALVLERMQPALNNLANPFLPLNTNTSVNPALAADLDGGWDLWLKRNSGKKKRKKHRQDQSALESLGPLSFEILNEPSQIAAALEAFFAMKARRFGERGISNVFADSTVRAFFHRLAADGHQQFDISVLRVGERPIAIAGHSLLPDRLVCEFSAFEPVDTDIRSVSPSLYMHFESIKRAANDGYRYYDFSVGDEEYKRRWCDTRTELFDVALGLTMKGRIYALNYRTLARMKRSVKSNDGAMRILQRIRRLGR